MSDTITRTTIQRAFAGQPMGEQKATIARVILRLCDSRSERFGLFVIYGWQSRWNRTHADVPDASQDIFAHNQLNILEPNSFAKIVATVNYDGAILVDTSGIILHSGILIEGVHPRLLADEVSPDAKDQDLSMRLGFKYKVHTRHLTAITASWALANTTVYTVSEESGDLHIFENGRILVTAPTKLSATENKGRLSRARQLLKWSPITR